MEITRDNLLLSINAGIKRHSFSVSGLERDAKVPKDTVRDFMRGKTHILRADKLQKILRILEPQDKVLISGYIYAGAEIVLESSLKHEVPCPPGFEPADIVAIRIQSDSVLPVFHKGWVIYYSRHPDVAVPTVQGGFQVPYNKPRAKAAAGAKRFAEFLNKPCVVGLNDGRILLGTLKPAETGKFYDIVNYNNTNTRNVLPQWAAKIVFIKTE